MSARERFRLRSQKSFPLFPAKISVPSLSFSLFVGRRSIRYLEGKRSFPWKSNGRLIVERKKKKRRRKKRKKNRAKPDLRDYCTPRAPRGFANSRDNVLLVSCLRLIYKDNCSKIVRSFFLTIRFDSSCNGDASTISIRVYKVSWPSLRNCRMTNCSCGIILLGKWIRSLRRNCRTVRLFPCVVSMARKGKITLIRIVMFVSFMQFIFLFRVRVLKRVRYTIGKSLLYDVEWIICGAIFFFTDGISLRNLNLDG